MDRRFTAHLGGRQCCCLPAPVVRIASSARGQGDKEEARLHRGLRFRNDFCGLVTRQMRQKIRRSVARARLVQPDLLASGKAWQEERLQRMLKSSDEQTHAQTELETPCLPMGLSLEQRLEAIITRIPRIRTHGQMALHLPAQRRVNRRCKIFARQRSLQCWSDYVQRGSRCRNHTVSHEYCCFLLRSKPLLYCPKHVCGSAGLTGGQRSAGVSR